MATKDDVGVPAVQALQPVDKRLVFGWEVIAFFVINVFAGVLHFAFELSGFYEPVALIASVNESTFEHLKLYFWPGLAFALVQHAYVKDRVHNYWWGKGLSLLVTPLAVAAGFYLYLGVVIPLYGRGTLLWTLIIGSTGVAVGNVVSFRQLTAPERGKGRRTAAWLIIVVLALLMATSAWWTPQFFIYEDFLGYQYTGQYGILDDYSAYTVFTGR